MGTFRTAALVALAALVLHCAVVDAQSYKEIWKPRPEKPIELNRPNNWDDTVKAECPKECATSGCCTMAWDAMSYVAASMPKANCSYCQTLRFTMGRLPKSEEVTCEGCLMEDFKKVITNFKCANDNGRCTKCCMDLSLIYVARFQFGCPKKLVQTVAKYAYKDTGFVYDGSSSCPRPPPSPSPPLPPGTVRQFTTAEEMLEFFTAAPAPASEGRFDDQPDAYDYLNQMDIGLATTNVDLFTPSEVLAAQIEAGIKPGGM